jgi:DICT domain-containing protein
VTHASPVALVHRRRRLRTGRKDVLLSASRALEAKAMDLGAHGVVAAAFQDARHFTPASRARYERLADQSAFVAALGVGMGTEPAPGVSGADLTLDDILRHEWNLAVLGPHYAGALVARDLGDAGPDRDRRFEFVLTFDRHLVVEVAASLVGRVIAGAA